MDIELVELRAERIGRNQFDRKLPTGEVIAPAKNLQVGKARRTSGTTNSTVNSILASFLGQGCALP